MNRICRSCGQSMPPTTRPICEACEGMIWIPVTAHLPAENVPVMTKIDDERGCRNECKLKRFGNLWFFEDGGMYVYYEFTHWRSL